MPAVTWDLPSGGTVNDVDPCLKIQNTIGNAMQAKSTDTAIVADSVDASAIVGRANQSIAAQFYTPTSVGVFILSPAHSGVFAANQTDASATVLGLCGQDPADPNASGGIGTFGINNRPISIGAAGYSSGIRSVGVVGQADQGIGVRAIGQEYGTESFGLTNHGIRAITFGQQSAGVRAEGVNQSDGVRATATAGRAVAAHSQAGTAVEGVSDSAHGVTGDASNRYAVGVRGTNDHVDGIGVMGLSSEGTASHAQSVNGSALHAESFNGTAIKARAVNAPVLDIFKGGPGWAIECLSLSKGIKIIAGDVPLTVNRIATTVSVAAHPNRGVDVFAFGRGVKSFSLTHAAIYGEGLKEAGAWGGYFKGDVKVTGTLYKGADCFMIDHPLDPANQSLVHAAIESDEYKNLYDGVAELDQSGATVVGLPEWFTALNTDFRYQLTAVGGPAPELHIAYPVKDNQFGIAGGPPGATVCWQVTGVRRDDWALANPLEVERPRRDDDREPSFGSHDEAETFFRRLKEEVEASLSGLEDLKQPQDTEAPETPEVESVVPESRDPHGLKVMAERSVDLAQKLSGDLEPGD